MNQVWSLFKQTLPFVWLRIGIYALFALGSIIGLGILLGIGVLLVKWFGSSSILLILILVSIFGLFGVFRLLQRYVLYLLKAAHVAVLVEIMDQGTVPEGKSQVAYGKDRVQSMFGTTSAFFAVDQLVSASVKQIHRWLMRLGNFLNAIPGAKVLIQIVSMILGIALNFIDESVLSRVMKEKKKDEKADLWKVSADGVVLYAQCWKGMIGTAAGVAAFTVILSVITFLIILFPLLFLANWIAGEGAFLLSLFGYIAAFTVTFAVKGAIVDPISTIAMIRTYHTRTDGITPSFDLKQKLIQASSKFKSLVSREGSDTGVPGTGPAIAGAGSVATPSSPDQSL